jgi:hypothetical protein
MFKRPIILFMAAITVVACGNNPSPSASMSVGPSATSSVGPSIPASVLATATPRATATASAAASPSGGGVDACALLPETNLSKILGGAVTVMATTPRSGWVAGECALNSPSSGFIVSVGTATSIKAFADPAAPNAKAKLALFAKQASATGTPTVVADIGDGAVLSASGMAAYKGGNYVQITNLRLTDEQLVKIMKLAIGRLQ